MVCKPGPGAILSFSLKMEHGIQIQATIQILDRLAGSTLEKIVDERKQIQFIVYERVCDMGERRANHVLQFQKLFVVRTKAYERIAIELTRKGFRISDPPLFVFVIAKIAVVIPRLTGSKCVTKCGSIVTPANFSTAMLNFRQVLMAADAIRQALAVDFGKAAALHWPNVQRLSFPTLHLYI